MDIPDLVRRTLGDEEIEAGVSLGDEDAVCVTPTRTLVYKGEGLLSDEQVEEFPHDVERVAVSEGRRKTKFVLEYIEGTRSFTVPSDRGEEVLEVLLEAVLRVASLVDTDESVVGVYRFSELTLIVAERRLVKLIGEQVWNDDHEVYDYEDVTGLEFERTSVATSIVVSVDGHPQRVKVPNDTAAVVRRTIEGALCDYYDVATVEELNRLVGDDSDGAEASDDRELDFGAGIDPLVTEDDEPLAEHTESALDDIPTGDTTDADADEPDASGPARADASTGENGDATGSGSATETDASAADSGADADASSAGADTGAETAGDPLEPSSVGGDAGPDDDASEDDDEDATAPGKTSESGASGDEGSEPASSGVDGVEPATREDLDVVADRLGELTEAVDRQNELLKRQHRAIKQLVDELQSE